MADTVERAILSVLNQSYKRAELIVMDGGSADGTVDIIKKFSNRLAYWTSAPDDGPSDAIAKALEHANGRYIGFLGADDWYEVYALETASVEAEKGEADICYGNMAVHRGDDIEFVDLLRFDPKKLYAHGTQWLGAVNAFAKKELLKENYAKKNDVLYTDWLFFLRLYAQNKRFMHIGDQRPITNFSVGGRTTTIDRCKAKEEAEKVREIAWSEYPAVFDAEKAKVDAWNKVYFAMDAEILFRKILKANDYLETIGEVISGDESVVLYGAGLYGRECAKMFQFIGRKIECFVDNNSDLTGKEIEGIKVYSTDYLKNVENHIIIITPSPLYQSEIENQLLELGVYAKNKVKKYSDFAKKIYDTFGQNVLDEAYEKGLLS